VIVNVAELWPASTKTLDGTEATELSDARLMIAPAGPVTPFRTTVPVVEPGPKAWPFVPTVIPLKPAGTTVIVPEVCDPFRVAVTVAIVL